MWDILCYICNIFFDILYDIFPLRSIFNPFVDFIKIYINKVELIILESQILHFQIHNHVRRYFTFKYIT